MPGWLVLAVVMLAFALIAFAWWAIDRRRRRRYAAEYAAWLAEQKDHVDAMTPQDRAFARPSREMLTPPTVVPFTGWAAIALGVLTLVFVLVSSFQQVGTKEVGVETSFGRTVGHLSNGPHLTAPWVYVHEMDGAVQTDSYVDRSGIADGCQAIPVRIANQQTGCASVSFQWRIRPSAVDELYKDYRSFEHVRDALVTRRLTAAVNEAFARYNPLNAISVGTGPGVPSAGKGETLIDIASEVTGIMKREVGAQIEVRSTILPIVTFDKATQDRINQLQQQVALTRVAQQEKQTNTAKASANAALATKSLDELVLVSRCLDTLGEMVKTDKQVPAGFSCWPGGSSPVSVLASPSKK